LAEKKIKIQQRNDDNSDFDTLYPETKADIVYFNDGTTVEDIYDFVNNSVKVFCSLTEPNAETNDVWFDLTDKIIKVKKSDGTWDPFGAVYL